MDVVLWLLRFSFPVVELAGLGLRKPRCCAVLQRALGPAALCSASCTAFSRLPGCFCCPPSMHCPGFICLESASQLVCLHACTYVQLYLHTLHSTFWSAFTLLPFGTSISTSIRSQTGALQAGWCCAGSLAGSQLSGAVARCQDHQGPSGVTNGRMPMRWLLLRLPALLAQHAAAASHSGERALKPLG